MNLHHLRYARAVMETQSFSRAAEQCHVSQPSLSVAISQLEEELGERLFQRTTRSVQLTPFGEYLAPVVEDAVRSLEEVGRAAERFRGTAASVIRLGMSPLIDIRLLKRVIEPFERNWATGKVVFKECMLGDLQQRLATQRIDAACTLHERRALAGFEACPLYSEPLLWLPQGGRDQHAGRPVAIHELASQTLIVTVDGCGLANATRKLFQRNRVRFQEYPGHALSYDVVEEWVGLDIGAGVLPLSKVRALKDSARPIIQNNGQPAKLTYELRWRASGRIAQPLKAFLQHFKTVVPKLLRGGAA